jgi:hypothetical protein
MAGNVESAQWWKFTDNEIMVATGQSLDQYLASLGAEYMHIIALATRPRFVAGFCMTLEHVHFPPGTPANERFHMTGVLWENVAWLVVSIPGESVLWPDSVRPSNTFIFPQALLPTSAFT